LAQQILLDMMKGKLTGFVKIKVTAIVNGSEYNGPLLIAIHNFTGEHKSELSERLVFDKSAIFPRQFIFKVNRIPITVIKGKIIYKPHEFFIHIANRKYIGGFYLIVEPDKPIKSIEVNIRLHPKKLTVKSFISSTSKHLVSSNLVMNECPESQVEVSYDYDWVRVGQVHSINGITVKWCITSNTAIHLSCYNRDITYKWSDWMAPCYALLEKTDSGWYKAGSSPADSVGYDYVEVSNGDARWVQGWVCFKCERWYISGFQGVDGEHYDYEYYIMTPIEIRGIEPENQVTCNECGSWPPPTYATEETASKRTVDFGSGDNYRWTVKSVTLSFTFSKETVTGTFSITLYRKASGSPPFIEINVNNWQASKYYWWYEDDDKNKHVVHLTWSQS